MEIIHYHFRTLISTNTWALENISTFDPKKITLVTADEQSGGRGTYGRKWIAPPEKNIYASFSFFIDEDQKDPLSLTHVLAISTIRTLERKGIACQIKWPNDVLVMRKKIAGILCETTHNPPYFGVVLGIGLNINMPQTILDEIDQPATSLLVETGKMSSIAEVLENLKSQFSKDLAQFLSQGFEPFLPTFRQLILPSLRNQSPL